MKLLKVLAALVVIALTISPAALAWHANDVSVSVECKDSTYVISASIDQSSEWPGAFIVSVTPSSVPGDTAGSVPVTVVIGWSETTETQTFYKSVTVDGTCKPETPPPPPSVPDNGPKDWCPNIDFTQQDSPEANGYVLDESGNCVVPQPLVIEQTEIVPPLVVVTPPVVEPPVIVEEEEPEVTEPEVIEESPATEEAPAPEATPSPQKPKPTPPKPPKEELPFTGGPSWPPIVAGIALLALGIGLRRWGLVS